MTARVMPVQRARAYVQAARGDSLVRNSLFLMSSTVATAGLGYVFWVVAARAFSTAQVGLASAVISLCSTVALFAYPGPAAMLVERLHAYERSRAWTAFLARTCAATAGVTAIAATVVVLMFAHSVSYGSFFSAAGAAVLAVAGAAAWSVLNICCTAFIAARRSDGLFAVQGLVSLLKVLFVVPLCAVGLGAQGIVVAWVASSVTGVAICGFWLLPRLGLGAAPPSAEPAASGAPAAPAGPGGTGSATRRDGARDERAPRRQGQGSDYLRHLVGQHLTGIGGQVTPLLLPVLVVLRLGAGPNAYFYITWMIGSVFFMVSPSISVALFAESVRSGSELRCTVVKAFRVASFLLLPIMLTMVASGKLVLGIFGHAYIGAGYELLVLLAISAVPDAVSNVAVAVCRATSRLGYSAAINLGILVVTAVGAWCLMPRFGVAGAGLGWLGAQVLGALASIPVLLGLDGRTKACKPDSRPAEGDGRCASWN